MGGNISCVPVRSDKLNASVRALGNINRKASINFGFVSVTRYLLSGYNLK